MQVVLKAPQVIGNRPYKAGAQSLPDHLMGNAKFRALVKAGQIVIAPKDANGVAAQASKDAQNAKKAELARQLSKKMQAKA
jgi:hypothetical protein